MKKKEKKKVKMSLKALTVNALEAREAPGVPYVSEACEPEPDLPKVAFQASNNGGFSLGG